MNDVSGQDLNWFFDEWVKQPNHPIYQNLFTIDTAARRVDVVLQQTQQSPSFFTMPVDLKFTFAESPDTTIRVFNNVNGQKFSFTFAGQPTNVIFDPNDNIVLKNGSTVQAGVISSDEARGLRYSLDQNYPNPFNPATNLQFTVAEVQNVSLRLYDLLGKEVATLVNAQMRPGKYTVRWDGTNAPSGIYFYRLQAGHFTQTRKLILLK
jgi:aminopeptidase N